jgi:hypothetical protein
MFTLHNGDGITYTEGLEPGQVYSLISDPPFNAGKEFENDNLSELDFRAFCNRFALAAYRLRPVNILLEVGKDDVTMRQEFERYFKFEYSIVLNYTNSMRNGKVGYSNFGLVLWFSNNGKCHARYKDRLDSALHDSRDEFEHPSPKEITHYSHLVRMFTPVGEVVLDPFMGTGTTGLACMVHGMPFIGAEKEPKYFAIAEKRIKSAALQQSFLTPSNTASTRQGQVAAEFEGFE